MSRLMEEPALKRMKEKSAVLEHFKVDQSADVTVVEEKPIEEYTLPHPIWSQVQKLYSRASFYSLTIF